MCQLKVCWQPPAKAGVSSTNEEWYPFFTPNTLNGEATGREPQRRVKTRIRTINECPLARLVSWLSRSSASLLGRK